jgi:hypothetical protein
VPHSTLASLIIDPDGHEIVTIFQTNMDKKRALEEYTDTSSSSSSSSSRTTNNKKHAFERQFAHVEV